MQQTLFPLDGMDSSNGLTTVYAKFVRSEPFSLRLFEGFDSLHVLTYSASIPMIVKMLDRFKKVECVFGYEGILHNLATIVAVQKEISENVITAIRGLDDPRQQLILTKIGEGFARFYVVKDAISHSKIYLLNSDDRFRVIVGSANLSDRAFSGRQAETIVVFDNDNAAWDCYWQEYTAVRETASSEVSVEDVTKTEIPFEEIPVIREAKNKREGVTVFVNTDTATATVPTVIRKVERIADHLNEIIQPVIKPYKGQARLTQEVVGKLVQLVRTRKREEQTQESTWLSINLDTNKVLLSGKELPLVNNWAAIKSDVSCLVEYYENFKNGFYGDVEQHQKDGSCSEQVSRYNRKHGLSNQ